MFLMIHNHMVRTTRYTLGIFRQEFLGQLLRTFWGGFGYMHITFLESSRYLWFLTALAGVGLLVAFVRWVIKGRSLYQPQLAVWAIVCTGLLLIVIAFIRFSVSTLGAGHGRYLFPAAATMGGLLIVGLNGFADWRGEKAISIILGLVMMGYGIWAPLAFAVPKYVGPEQITLDELEQSTATHCDWVFDNTVKLAAYSIEPNLAMPDTWLSLRLYWQGVGPSASRPDAYVRANLIDDAGQTLYSASFWPAKSTTPSAWAEGEVIVSQSSLHVPTEGYSGSLHIQVVLTDGRGGNPLSLADGSQFATLGPILSVGEIAEVMEDEILNSREEMLGQSIALAGYSLPTLRVMPGQPMVVRLFWRVLEAPIADYTVFIHVLDEKGQLVAQFDGPPGGNLRTTAWRPGQILANSYPVAMPSVLAAGDYQILIGLYSWPSMERQPVLLHGAPAGDTISLGQVTITPNE